MGFLLKGPGKMAGESTQASRPHSVWKSLTFQKSPGGDLKGPRSESRDLLFWRRICCQELWEGKRGAGPALGGGGGGPDGHHRREGTGVAEGAVSSGWLERGRWW